MVCVLLSHGFHVMSHSNICPVICDIVMWYFPALLPCVVSPKEKEKKRNINNNLAVLPSHDNIRPSKLPQTSPVFFVGKKDRKKRMVQDYWYLNKETVKDNYPLPLIFNLIDTMETKRVFTKMDLQFERSHKYRRNSSIYEQHFSRNRREREVWQNSGESIKEDREK